MKTQVLVKKEYRFNHSRLNIEYNFLKRVFDFIFALFALVFALPLFIVVAGLIKVYSSEGKVFFTQKRLGLDGTRFNLYKFRTMVPNAEEKLNKMLESDDVLKKEYLTFRKLKKDPRIIPHVGDFLRKSSLDELPQFINVLFGEMSIVGPRPYIENEFDIYPTKLKQKIITAVKPGITGYWQVIPERHDTTFESRVDTDIEYVEKKSFLLDLEIVLKTFGVMALKKGA